MTLAGELDVATAPVVRAGLDRHVAAAPSRLVIDLQLVEFMDCSGLTPLIMTAGRLHASGGVLTLRHPRPSVRRLLEACGVAEVPGISIDDPTALHPARRRARRG